MEVTYNKSKKLCEIWMTNVEKNDRALRASLDPVYKANKKQGYMTVVYESGEDDLYGNMLALLVHNRKAAAPEELARGEA